MTHEQVVANVVIALVVGLFLIIVGAVLQPLLKRLWERINRPSPLTPQTRGQLMGQLLTWEAELERLSYLSTHEKDLFLHLFQVFMAASVLSVIAFWLYAVRLILATPLPVDFFLVLVVVVLTFAGLFFAVAMLEAGRVSDKKIDATKKGIQKRIDEINKQLNPPDSM